MSKPISEDELRKIQSNWGFTPGDEDLMNDIDIDMLKSVDRLVAEIRRLRAENEELCEEAEKHCKHSLEGQLFTRTQELKTIVSAASRLEEGCRNLFGRVDSGWMIDFESLCDDAKRLIALGKAVEEMPYGQTLVNDQIHGWSVILDERGNVRLPARSSPLEALQAAKESK